MILWIVAWMIGASLVLAGYLHRRHNQEMLALDQGLLPARLEGGLARRAISARRTVPGADRDQRASGRVT